MVSRTISTVWWRLTTPVNARGAAPKTSAVTGEVPYGSRYHATNALMPACTINPIHERSSADSRWNQGMSRSIRFTVEVVSRPTERCSCRAMFSRSRVSSSGMT
jgi:hypothetical protein